MGKANRFREARDPCVGARDVGWLPGSSTGMSDEAQQLEEQQGTKPPDPIYTDAIWLHREDVRLLQLQPDPLL